MTDVNGTVVARYDYDPWGRSTTVIGTNKPDFNFTGLYQHAKSGLDMATYRFYDPDLGRWLNRDPIAERGEINLYGYVRNNPFRYIDILGLDPFMVTGILRVDDDGEGPSHNDPFHNSVTPGSDIPNGPHVNADIDAYVASTPAARKAGVKIGDQADLITNGRTVHCKVGDSRTSEGPEASVNAVQDAGLTVIDKKNGPEIIKPGAKNPSADVPATIIFNPAPPKP